MRRLWPLLFVLLFLVPAGGAEAADRPLVYTIVIDGMDGDRVDAGDAPFISALLAGQQSGVASTYYHESRSTMIAETNPNHTSMATGAYGGFSGIPGNSFAVYGKSDGDSCPAASEIDESKPPTPTDGQSPSCLQAETIFQTLDREAGPGVTTAGIFGKPKLGRIFSGKRPDGRLWADYLWAPCEGSDDDTPYCAQVATNPITGYSIDDKTVMDEVIRTVRDGVPADGATKRPDYTFVNLPLVDSAGHATGTGASYTAAIKLADEEIRRLFEALRDEGLLSRAVVLIVSDHSMETSSTRIGMGNTFTAAGIDSGSYTIVQNGSAELVYLNDRTASSRFELLKRMRAAALGAGASQALYREPNPADGGAANTLDGVHPDWKLAGPRAGDLVLIAPPGSAFSDPLNPLPGNHGGPQTRDNFMAVIGGAGVVKQADVTGVAADGYDDTAANPGQSENVDVAPTVARLLGYEGPKQAQGRILGEAFVSGALPQVQQDAPPLVAVGRLKVSVTPKHPRIKRLTRFRVRVLGDGKPLKRARVSFAGKRLRTDARGYVTLRKKLGRPKLYRVRAAASGYLKRSVYVRARR